MTIGAVKETFEGERRVALVPGDIGGLLKAGCDVLVEQDAGSAAGYGDEAYTEKGAAIVSRDELFERSDLLLSVRFAAAAGESGAANEPRLRSGQTIIGMLEPYEAHPGFNEMAERGVTSFAMELMPRITRAQSMDVLSSMANLSGYKAALIAADHLPRMFPMMMTAAGTIVPARVLVLGAGVAGLQAIATAKRLGGVVSAYDIRSAVREQVESLGARFVELDIDAGDAETAGGYARAMGEEFYRRQQEALTAVIAEHDVVIATAAVPGKRAPILVPGDAVARMQPGSVIVDLAAERGGNCELTEPGRVAVRHGVTVIGPLNLPSTLAWNASQLYSRNVVTFARSLIKDGALSIDRDDEIVAATLVTHGGSIVRDGLNGAVSH